MARRDGKATLRFIVLALYMLAALCTAETGVIVYLYAVHQVDDTMAASLILTFSAAQVTDIYLSFHAFLARRQRKAGPHPESRTKLHSCVNTLPRLMLVVWMAACAVGLFVAARQPTCLPGQAAQNFWQIGLSCRLHRATVGMAVVAFVSNCVLFSAAEVSGRRYYASFGGVFAPEPESPFRLQTSNSGSSWSSTSSADSIKRSKLYHYRDGGLDSEMEKQAWLQRQKSLSTQPMYPLSLRYTTPHPLSQHGSIRYSVNPPSTFRPQIPNPLSARRPSTSSTLAPSVSSYGTSCSGPTRAPSSVSSVSASSSIRRSPLSTMRRASEPEVPLIPEKFKRQASQLPLTIPDAWPILSGPSLMSDPQIRAFSLNASSPEPTRPASSSSLPGPAPAIPPRDPKRMTLAPNRPGNAQSYTPVYLPTPPPITYSSAPRIHPQPRVPLSLLPSTVELSVKKTGPSQLVPKAIDGLGLLTTSQPARSGNQCNKDRPPNVDFAPQNVAEAQRMRKRFEEARMREGKGRRTGDFGFAFDPEGQGRLRAYSADSRAQSKPKSKAAAGWTR